MDWKSLENPYFSPVTTEEASMTRSGCSMMLGLCYFNGRIASPSIVPPSCVSFNKLTLKKNQTNLGGTKKWSISFDSSCGYVTDDPRWEEREEEEHVVRHRRKRQEE